MDAATELFEKARLAAVNLDGGRSFLKASNSEAKVTATAEGLHKLGPRLEEPGWVNSGTAGSQFTQPSQPQGVTGPQDVRYEPRLEFSIP